MYNEKLLDDDCMCLNCGEHAVNMEDGEEVCDSCYGEANCIG